MYETTRMITLRDADAAGVLFFARYLALAHDVYEEMMAERGLGLGKVLRELPYGLPIAHAECDYCMPLWVGDTVTIRLRVEELKRRSFTVVFEFLVEDGRTAATCRTVHVPVDRATGKPIPLPEELIAALTRGA